jgi:hypothetical protein
MSYSNKSHTKIHHYKRGLYDFVHASSRWYMEGENDLARYYEHFLALSEPLLFFHNVSKRE